MTSREADALKAQAAELSEAERLERDPYLVENVLLSMVHILSSGILGDSIPMSKSISVFQ